MFIRKIRQVFCNHSDLGKVKYYYEDVKYNKHFNTVQAMEYSYRLCHKCFRRIETCKARWVSLRLIEQEVTEKYKKENK